MSQHAFELVDRTSTMASIPRISPYPIPSFSHWRWNMPHMELHNQHKSVYYATVASRSTKRMVQLFEKRRIEKAERAFRAERERLVAEQRQRYDDVSRLLSAPQELWAGVNHAVLLNRFALQDHSSATVEGLSRHGKLTTDHYARLIESLSAGCVVDLLKATECRFDLPLAYKKAADWSGHSRAREAAALLERADATLEGRCNDEAFQRADGDLPYMWIHRVSTRSRIRVRRDGCSRGASKRDHVLACHAEPLLDRQPARGCIDFLIPQRTPRGFSYDRNVRDVDVGMAFGEGLPTVR